MDLYRVPARETASRAAGGGGARGSGKMWTSTVFRLLGSNPQAPCSQLLAPGLLAPGSTQPAPGFGLLAPGSNKKINACAPGACPPPAGPIMHC